MKKRKFLTALFGLILAVSLVGFAACNTAKTVFTVSFEPNNGTTMESIEVIKGRKITGVNDPEKDGSVFIGWYQNEDLSGSAWEMDKDIVVRNMTLYASWLEVTDGPSSLAMKDEPFTSSVTWVQNESTLNADSVKVTVKNASGERDLAGDVTVEEGYKVTFVPSEEVAGGVYEVTVSTDKGTASAQNCYFQGAGSAENPYLAVKDSDLLSLVTAKKTVFNHYKMMADITVSLTYNDVAGTVFAGEFDGNNHTVTMQGCATALFDSNEGTIRNLNITGTISSTTNANIGSVANKNSGVVEYCATMTREDSFSSTAGTVGDISTLSQGGLGGIVGINQKGGVVRSCTNNARVSANIGGGGIVGVNYGTVEKCTNYGRIGAGNNLASGKGATKASYSYAGGVVGVNYGTVSQCATSALSGAAYAGNVFAQRNVKGGEDNGNNYLGGIVGLNEKGAVVTETVNVAKNMNGDNYIGGIAGQNKGTITYSYATSEVGGRTYVGGIAGNNTGTIEYCWTSSAFNSNTGSSTSEFNRADTDSFYAVSDGTVNNCVYMTETDGTLPTGTGNEAGTETTMATKDAVSGKWVEKDGLTELDWRTKETVNVTFVINGDTQVVAVIKGESAVAPHVDVAEGYVFVEWRTDLNDPESVWEDGSAVTMNITVYAYIMEVQPYTVKFDADGGEGTMADQQFGASEEKALAPNAFTKAGYTFVCWEYNGKYYLDGQVISMLSPTGADVVMKAVWLADSDPEFVPNGDFGAAEEFVESETSRANQFASEKWTIYTNASKSKINSVSTQSGALTFNATTTTGSSISNFYVAVQLNIDEIVAGDKFVVSFETKSDSADFTYLGAYIRAKVDGAGSYKTITDLQNFDLTTNMKSYTFVAEATEENVTAAEGVNTYYLIIGFADDSPAGTPTFTLDNVSVKRFVAPSDGNAVSANSVTLFVRKDEE